MIEPQTIVAVSDDAVAPAGQNRTAARRSAMLLTGQFIAMWTAFFILAPAINWPASLGEPPEVMLPLIADHSAAVFFGYLAYLIHALLLIPAAAFIPSALGMDEVQKRNATMFGALAGFAKALGISRWLFLIPGLATAYGASGATVAGKAAIIVVYKAFNAYAGGVGEILGVGLFAGVWILMLSVALFKSGARLLGATGIASALLLLSTLLSVVGIESPILLTGSGIIWQFWTMALAISLWRQR